MDDLETIRKRMKNKKRSSYQSKKKKLNDTNFNSFYRFMIKTMVLIIICLGIFTFYRINPNNKLFNAIFIEQIDFSKATKYVNSTILNLLPNFNKTNKSEEVSSTIYYQHIENNIYKKSDNMVTSVDKGTVVLIGNQEILGDYMVVQQQNGVKVTYGNIETMTAALYDVVDKNTTLGTYNNQLLIIFELNGSEITYEKALAIK